MTKEKEIKSAKIDSLDVIFPLMADTSTLLVGCPCDDYMASRIARAVEDVDARLLNLNVTSLPLEGSRVAVSLRVNHRNPDAVTRSLERYGYEVLAVDAAGGDPDDRELRDRYNLLMKYLYL